MIDSSNGGSRYRLAAYLIAGVFALSFGLDLYRMPIQVPDSLAEIVVAQDTPSVRDAFVRNFQQQAYMRPLRIAQIQAIFDAAQGRYHLAYRGFHTALFVLTLFLFMRALQVSNVLDLVASAFALTVFLGSHTLAGAVGSAFPINHFLEVTCFCLLALNIAQGQPSWIRDVAAMATFVAAALTLESGLLVWVVLVGGWLVGLRGVSRRAVVALSMLLVAYLGARFLYFGTGTPGLTERSSGYLFDVLDPEDLEARFGGMPLYFYGYNIISSLFSVLAAEPRAGVFVFTRYLTQENEVPPWAVVAVVSSVVTTIVIVWGAWRMVATREHGRDGRCVALFALVLVANAVLSYAYTKDEIIGVAGAFYAVAAFGAVRHLLGETAQDSRVLRAVPLIVLLAVAACGWATRTAGLHHILVYQGFKQRNDWTITPRVPNETAQATALIRQLRQEVIDRPVPLPRFLPRWTDQWFEE